MIQSYKRQPKHMFYNVKPFFTYTREVSHITDITVECTECMDRNLNERFS